MLRILQNHRDDLLNYWNRLEIRWNTAISIFVRHFPFKKWSIFLPELQSRPNSTKFGEWAHDSYGVEVKEHDGAGYKAIRIWYYWLFGVDVRFWINDQFLGNCLGLLSHPTPGKWYTKMFLWIWLKNRTSRIFDSVSLKKNFSYRGANSGFFSQLRPTMYPRPGSKSGFDNFRRCTYTFPVPAPNFSPSFCILKRDFDFREVTLHVFLGYTKRDSKHQGEGFWRC